MGRGFPQLSSLDSASSLGTHPAPLPLRPLLARFPGAKRRLVGEIAVQRRCEEKARNFFPRLLHRRSPCASPFRPGLRSLSLCSTRLTGLNGFAWAAVAFGTGSLVEKLAGFGSSPPCSGAWIPSRGLSLIPPNLSRGYAKGLSPLRAPGASSLGSLTAQTLLVRSVAPWLLSLSLSLSLPKKMRLVRSGPRFRALESPSRLRLVTRFGRTTQQSSHPNFALGHRKVRRCCVCQHTPPPQRRTSF